MILPGFPRPALGKAVVIEDVQSLPAMTSDAAPSGNFAAASSVYSSGNAAFKAFDQSTASTWACANGAIVNSWVRRYTQTAIKVGRYRVSFGGGLSVSMAPSQFRLQGSNNASTWVDLDVRTDQSAWGGTETRTYDVASPQLYTYHRLLINSNNGHGSLVGIAELELLQVI